jgi:hypothetical protein
MHVARHIFHSLLLCALPGVVLCAFAARAQEGSALQNFTQSITSVYTSSAQCQYTVSPGPTEYMNLITDYFGALYPGGAGYWALPDKVKLIKSRDLCSLTLQRDLLAYRAARADYEELYPSAAVPPPVLVAYQWEKMRPKETAPPKYSYQPKTQKPTLDKGFGER